MKTLRLWWRWHKAKRKQYPYRYVGPTVTLRGVTIEYGTPLRMTIGPKGSRSGRRFVAPDGIVRLLPTSQIEWR